MFKVIYHENKNNVLYKHKNINFENNIFNSFVISTISRKLVDSLLEMA